MRKIAPSIIQYTFVKHTFQYSMKIVIFPRDLNIYGEKPQTCKMFDDQRSDNTVYARYLSRKAVVRSTGIMGLILCK